MRFCEGSKLHCKLEVMTKLLYKRESNVRFLVLLWFSILIAFHHFVHRPRTGWMRGVGVGFDPSPGSNLVTPFRGAGHLEGVR